VGCLDACRAAGKYLARLADYVTSGVTETQDKFRFDSQAEEQMAELLKEMGLWYQPQYPEGPYRFDFLVVSPFGSRYDLEVDGRGHWTSEQLYADEVRDKAIEALGYRVIRVSARDLLAKEALVRTWLARMI
jgi:very-short-patch-repair endonuclease